MISKVIRLKTRIEKLGYLSYLFFLPISKVSNTVITILKITQLLQSQVSKFFFYERSTLQSFQIDPKLHNLCDGESTPLTFKTAL